MKATFVSKDWGKFMPKAKTTMTVAPKGALLDFDWITDFLGWAKYGTKG
jgi:hypothetical protein